MKRRTYAYELQARRVAAIKYARIRKLAEFYKELIQQTDRSDIHALHRLKLRQQAYAKAADFLQWRLRTASY